MRFFPKLRIGRAASKHRQRCPRRPHLEVLEDRLVPSLSPGTGFPPGFFGFGSAQPAQPIATTTTVTSSANPAGYGQVVTFTATIAGGSFFGGTPTGAVQFAMDGMNSGGPVNVSTTNGVTTASYSTVIALLGTHNITAAYSGDSGFLSSSGSLAQIVNVRLPSTTSVSTSLNPSNVGQSVTFTATVSGVDLNGGLPTGTVQFLIDGRQAGAPVMLTTTGNVTTAAYSTASLSGGPHVVVAVYSGNTGLTGSIGYLPALQVVIPAATGVAVSSSSNPSAPGQPVTFTAALSLPTSGTATPTGTVQFSVDDTPAGIAALSPAGFGRFTASFTTSSLAAGTHTVTASYSGDNTFAASIGTLPGGQIVGSGTPIPGGGGGGGGGNVLVTLNIGAGMLSIMGFNDNVAISLSQGAGMLQIAGSGTLLNQSASPISYALSSINQIDISLLNGNDSLALNNVSIPGSISIFAGSGSDNLSLGSIAAGTIRISVTGPGNSAIGLNNTTAGSINVAAGANAALSLSGVNNTGPVLLTAGNNATVSVIGLTTTGDLDITAGDNAQAISVKNSSTSNVTILQSGTTGNPTFDLESDAISSDLRLTAGGGNNSLVLSQLSIRGRMFVNLGAGQNTVTADQVTALFGTLDGGSSGNNNYIDGGGNSGFSVFDFVGK